MWLYATWKYHTNCSWVPVVSVSALTKSREICTLSACRQISRIIVENALKNIAVFANLHLSSGVLALPCITSYRKPIQNELQKQKSNKLILNWRRCVWKLVDAGDDKSDKRIDYNAPVTGCQSSFFDSHLSTREINLERRRMEISRNARR